MNTIPLNALINIQGKRYRQVITKDIKIGDFVLDTKDGCYGICNMLMGNDRIAIKDVYVVEVGVPISRVRRLDLIIIK